MQKKEQQNNSSYHLSTVSCPQELLNDFQQIALIKLAFDNISLCTGLQATASMSLGSQTSDNNNWQIEQPQVGTNAAGQLEPIHARHFNIANYQIVGSGAEFVKRVEAIDGSCNIVAGRLKDSADQLAGGERVIGDQQA